MMIHYLGYQVLISNGPDICHRDCTYAIHTVLQTVQMSRMPSDAYRFVQVL